jgi:hypothetical protein
MLVGGVYHMGIAEGGMLIPAEGMIKALLANAPGMA